ncbi:hypothetical protein ACFLIM_33640 [Nonomuraea sp. M3C6]|uniref:Uncharacterized protein n=1 Tax=Nonomuraea marmarensis TaxID=3351344 RepID=A0ABW7ALF1_9ACTN
MDLIDRVGTLKGTLVDFALSPRFARELDAVFEQSFPDGVITDEATATMVASAQVTRGIVDRAGDLP